MVEKRPGGKQTRETRKGLKLTQITVAQWRNTDGELTYSLYGLDQDGQVWRKVRDGWSRILMTLTEEN